MSCKALSMLLVLALVGCEYRQVQVEVESGEYYGNSLDEAVNGFDFPIEDLDLDASAEILGENFSGEIFGKEIESTWTGEVVRVIDGDTIEVLKDGDTPIKVRLESIDCPETKQPFSEKAKSFVSNYCFGQEVVVYETGKDRYDRSLAFVSKPGVPAKLNLSLVLIDSGLAWHYKKYSDSEYLADLETEAKKAKRGLWSDQDPIPPWDWRKR